MSSKIEYINVEKLKLDPDNDRFAELYSGSKKEEELIQYLLFSEAADEIAKSISDRNAFYADEALWVLELPSGNYLVKDGNRRCAAAKALKNPKKAGLSLQAVNIEQLPVLIFENKAELDRRIQERHTNSLFREWDSIAKALKAYEMHISGSSEDLLREIDSNPSRLIKLASFYYEAVKVSGDDFKRLLRRGRTSDKGKTIIFERLFKFSTLCGYSFKSKPSYEIQTTDKDQFDAYISALVKLLNTDTSITHKVVDSEQAGFLNRLKPYGFTVKPQEPRSATGSSPIRSESGETPPVAQDRKKGSVQKYPSLERKLLNPSLKKIIVECYQLDGKTFPNAKMALARVVFETSLKYAIYESNFGGKKLKDYKHFETAFYEKGNKRKFTNFTNLKDKFCELITETGKRKAFGSFDLDNLHQIIHNYQVGALPANAQIAVDNLMPLIEFMLQEEGDLIAALDTTKLS